MRRVRNVGSHSPAPILNINGTPTRGLAESQIEAFYAEINRIRMKKFAEQRRMMPRFARRTG